MAEDKKNRILYIVTKSVWAGAGKYVYDLAANLPKDRFFVAVAAGGNGELARKIQESDIKYFEIKNFQKSVNPLKDFFAIFEILKIINNLKPDVIHVNSSKAGGLVGLAAFIYKILYFLFSIFYFLRSSPYPKLRTLNPKPYTLNPRPYTLNPKLIFTAHGWAFNESRPKWQLFLIKFFSKLTAKLYDKIICVSEYDRITALKNKIAPAEKLVTIHNGIRPEEYNFLSKEKAREKLSEIIGKEIKNSDLVIGNIGEFTKNKNQSLLIDATKILLAGSHALNPKPYTLMTILIGWGEEKKNLESRIKNLKLDNDVFLAENIFPAAPYLKAFDVFILPSLKEGLPYVLLEAGLAEIPVISGNAGGSPEIINNSSVGILYNEQNPEVLAKIILNLIKNKPQREILGKNLKNQVLQNFSIKKMIEETLTMYTHY